MNLIHLYLDQTATLHSNYTHQKRLKNYFKYRKKIRVRHVEITRSRVAKRWVCSPKCPKLSTFLFCNIIIIMLPFSQLTNVFLFFWKANAINSLLMNKAVIQKSLLGLTQRILNFWLKTNIILYSRLSNFKIIFEDNLSNHNSTGVVFVLSNSKLEVWFSHKSYFLETKKTRKIWWFEF